jgi:transposase InsO family protein
MATCACTYFISFSPFQAWVKALASSVLFSVVTVRPMPASAASMSRPVCACFAASVIVSVPALMPDETSRRYLFVAIDRATRWVFVHIYGDMTDKSSVDFLRRLKLASPIKITKILTDNVSQFTDRFSMKDKKPSGEHAFDRACSSMAVEHRLAPPRHPQTNGMVELFNGRISELLQQT